MVVPRVNSKLNSRRALEALRNGVPNGDAVAVLGCNQPEVEQVFTGMLSRMSGEGAGPEGGQGMLVAGEFGSGKSHLLGYLESQALSRNFVCSRVVISKETPLFDMDKVYRAVVENGKVPGVNGVRWWRRLPRSWTQNPTATANSSGGQIGTTTACTGSCRPP